MGLFCKLMSCWLVSDSDMINNVIHPLYSAFLICDRIGRIWATRQLCLLWIIGIAIFMANGGSLGAVYAGRFVAGLGIGQTVVVAPVYLAEIVSLFTNNPSNASAKFCQLVTCSYSWYLHLCFYRVCLSGNCPCVLCQLWLCAPFQRHNSCTMGKSVSFL